MRMTTIVTAMMAVCAAVVISAVTCFREGLDGHVPDDETDGRHEALSIRDSAGEGHDTRRRKGIDLTTIVKLGSEFLKAFEHTVTTEKPFHDTKLDRALTLRHSVP